MTKRRTVKDVMTEAGFVRLPPLWVRPEHMPAIHRITSKSKNEVNELRAKLRKENGQKFS